MSHRWLPVLLALVLVLATAPPAAAKEPTLFRGVAHYTENGPGAGTDGIATAFLVGGAGGGVAIARLQSAIGPLLSLAAAGGLGDNPSISSISDVISNSVPVNLAGMLPVSGYYDARLVFTLEQQPDGLFTLQEGSIAWRVNNGAEILGDGTSITDQFSGSGSEPLDPEEDDITLAFDFSGERTMYELTIDVDHRQPTTGESTWVAAEGAFILWTRSRDGVQTMGGQTMGQEIPEEIIHSEPQTRGVYYSHRGPLSELRHMETYRNLLDAQVLMDYEIYDECSASVTVPEPDARLTLETCYQCGLEGELEADVLPDVWAEDLVWKLPTFGGKEATFDPEDATGSALRYWYTGPAPESNSEFGPRAITLSFEGSEAACRAPEPRRVRIFFPRDKHNNPDPSGRIPNWFYYWKQTPAAQGHAGAMTYDEDCTDAYGYFSGWSSAADSSGIYICPLFNSGSSYTNPVTGKFSRGIDFYAAIVRHEWTHLENYHDWWPQGYRATDHDDGSWDPDPADRDKDLVRDSREAAYGLSSRTQDSLGFGFRDSEYPPYLQMDTWANGSADRQDWADPGKQSGS